MPRLFRHHWQRKQVLYPSILLFTNAGSSSAIWLLHGVGFSPAVLCWLSKYLTTTFPPCRREYLGSAIATRTLPVETALWKTINFWAHPCMWRIEAWVLFSHKPTPWWMSWTQKPLKAKKPTWEKGTNRKPWAQRSSEKNLEHAKETVEIALVLPWPSTTPITHESQNNHQNYPSLLAVLPCL